MLVTRARHARAPPPAQMSLADLDKQLFDVAAREDGVDGGTLLDRGESTRLARLEACRRRASEPRCACARVWLAPADRRFIARALTPRVVGLQCSDRLCAVVPVAAGRQFVPVNAWWTIARHLMWLPHDLALRTLARRPHSGDCDSGTRVLSLTLNFRSTRSRCTVALNSADVSRLRPLHRRMTRRPSP